MKIGVDRKVSRFDRVLHSSPLRHSLNNQTVSRRAGHKARVQNRTRRDNVRGAACTSTVEGAFTSKGRYGLAGRGPWLLITRTGRVVGPTGGAGPTGGGVVVVAGLGGPTEQETRLRRGGSHACAAPHHAVIVVSLD